jgi:hypothetical protein
MLTFALHHDMQRFCVQRRRPLVSPQARLPVEHTEATKAVLGTLFWHPVFIFHCSGQKAFGPSP